MRSVRERGLHAQGLSQASAWASGAIFPAVGQAWLGILFALESQSSIGEDEEGPR